MWSRRHPESEPRNDLRNRFPGNPMGVSARNGRLAAIGRCPCRWRRVTLSQRGHKRTAGVFAGPPVPVLYVRHDTRCGLILTLGLTSGLGALLADRSTLKQGVDPPRGPFVHISWILGQNRPQGLSARRAFPRTATRDMRAIHAGQQGAPVQRQLSDSRIRKVKNEDTQGVARVGATP